MILGAEEMKRIEELKRNEELLYKCIEYLFEVWDWETKDTIIENFKLRGFTEEDFERLGIMEE